MVKQVKDKRRKNAKKKKFEPKPEWVQAFMIYLLHKNGGSLTLPLKSLRMFEALKSANLTDLTYDEVAETVTITAPEAKLPEKSKIIHNKGIQLTR
jgi:hypothetical protein